KAVRRITRTGHNGSDEAGRIQVTGQRIDGYTLALRILHWLIELHGLSRIVIRWNKVQTKSIRLMPRREIEKAKPVIQRQPSARFPGVLQIPLEIQTANVLGRPESAFLIGIESTKQGIGVRIVGVERIIDVGSEIEGALIWK